MNETEAAYRRTRRTKETRAKQSAALSRRAEMKRWPPRHLVVEYLVDLAARGQELSPEQQATLADWAAP